MNTHNPETNFAELDPVEGPRRIRAIRDFLIQEYVDKINAVRWNAMSVEKQAEWTVYRQALLDITTLETYPWKITWPTKPE